MVALGLQQQGIHVRMAGDACGFCLDGLGTTYLQTIRCGVGIEGHILSLKGSRVVAVLLEDTTEGRSHDAFADVAARSSEHDGMQPTPNPSPREGGLITFKCSICGRCIQTPLPWGGVGGGC